MAAKKMKWSPPRATALASVTVAALVTACDTEAPTAIDDVLANPEAAADADGSGNPVSEVIKGTLGDGPPPLVFVDGVEVTNPDSLLHGWVDADKRIGADDIKRIEVGNIKRIEIFKGEAAAGLVGGRGAGGVIHIFTKEYWEERNLEEPQEPAEPGEPSPSPTLPPS